jgi:hypothetical protein
MKKSTASSRKGGRRPALSRSGLKQQAGVAAVRNRLDELRLESPKAAGLIDLHRSWLADESGYDEETWPKLKKALEQERRHVGDIST